MKTNSQKYERRAKLILKRILIAVFGLEEFLLYKYTSSFFISAIPVLSAIIFAFIVVSFIEDDYCYLLEFVSEEICLLTVKIRTHELGTFKFNLKTIVVDKIDKFNMQIRDNDYQKNPIQIPYCKKLENAIQQAKLDYLTKFQ